VFRIFRQRTPQEIAELGERILDGRNRGLDVDSYENANIRDAILKDLHIRTLHFGLPETWVKLDNAQKGQLRGIIEEMRRLGSSKL
jgi:hypothetical protein